MYPDDGNSNCITRLALHIIGFDLLRCPTLFEKWVFRFGELINSVIYFFVLSKVSALFRPVNAQFHFVLIMKSIWMIIDLLCFLILPDQMTIAANDLCCYVLGQYSGLRL